MSFLDRFKDGRVKGYIKHNPDSFWAARLSKSLLEKIVAINSQSDSTSDLVIREFEASGVHCALMLCEGMFNLEILNNMILKPLAKVALPGSDPNELLKWVRNYGLTAADQKEIYTYGEAWQFALSGFAILFIDGIEPAVVMGVQGFNFRSVSEPSAEINIRGSREGFVEPVRINMTLIRRRIKSPTLKFEQMNFGTKSHTDAFLVYITDTVSPKLLREVRHKLSKINMEVVLDTGYLQPFLEARPFSLFSGVGVTERPDVLCAKLAEGRVGIILDGTPFALIIPYLFAENFQSLDDYSHRPYYATFIRIIKYLAFLMTILLPGTYVAVVTFNPELLPAPLLYNIAVSVESTPFPLVLEALIIHLLYEIMREAGIRLPRAIGHAVSIVGGLVIGDAAVRAGLVGTPMVMILALTAITSFVVPSIYEPVTILRFAFIIIGGALGVFGITLGLALVLVNLCALEAQGVPVMAPASPFRLYSLRDLFVRWSWKTLQKHNLEIQNLPGSNIEGEGGDN